MDYFLYTNWFWNAIILCARKLTLVFAFVHCMLLFFVWLWTLVLSGEKKIHVCPSPPVLFSSIELRVSLSCRGRQIQNGVKLWELLVKTEVTMMLWALVLSLSLLTTVPHRNKARLVQVHVLYMYCSTPCPSPDSKQRPLVSPAITNYSVSCYEWLTWLWYIHTMAVITVEPAVQRFPCESAWKWGIWVMINSENSELN